MKFTLERPQGKKEDKRRKIWGWVKSSGWMVVAFSPRVCDEELGAREKKVTFRDKLRFQPSHQGREKFGSGSNYRHRHR